MESVPIVDFSAYSLDRDEPDPDLFQKLIDDIYEAFTTIGFVYLKNYDGVLDEKVDKVYEVTQKFFLFDYETKMKCEQPKGSYGGFIRVGTQSASQTEDVMKRPHMDLREGFLFYPPVSQKAWPEGMPELRENVEDLLLTGKELLHRVLEVIARGLKYEDPLIFVKSHQKTGTAEGCSSIRLNHYPPTADIEVEEKQVRCGEHSDYGSITLLFQKDQGGLEILNRQGQWVSAPPIDGTIVVNIGDALQRWSADKLLSSKHRVVNPVSESDKRADRYSIIYFGSPDVGTTLECVDGSNKYPPINLKEYNEQQYNKQYNIS
ncbi:uncharacterized protein [Amphiura filiformis]|uniref:uncharacterized protein isoform X1 n=2 Tax=Amphiura filiformis TaxID=82378 RepID=UPI003B223788